MLARMTSSGMFCRGWFLSIPISVLISLCLLSVAAGLFIELSGTGLCSRKSMWKSASQRYSRRVSVVHTCVQLRVSSGLLWFWERSSMFRTYV